MKTLFKKSIKLSLATLAALKAGDTLHQSHFSDNRFH
jgi:hypothetical protein